VERKLLVWAQAVSLRWHAHLAREFMGDARATSSTWSTVHA